MEKILIIYHRIDFDGLCSMSVISHWAQKNNIQADILGYNYTDNPPQIPQSYDWVFVVDCCLPTEEMIRLHNEGVLVWIDHHVTAIQESNLKGFSTCPGIRKEGYGACEMCWELLFPDKELPLFIKLLSAYDTWDKKRQDWEGQTLPFQYGLRNRIGLDREKFFCLFESQIDRMDDTNNVSEIIKEGSSLIKYIRNSGRNACKNYAFEVTIGRQLKGLAMLTSQFGALQMEESVRESGCQVAVCINKSNDTEDYVVSVYACGTDIGDFNIGAYMKSHYRGGGHRSAAGGRLTHEEFLRLMNKHKL